MDTQRKTYTSPTLTEYGSITQLTLDTVVNTQVDDFTPRTGNPGKGASGSGT